MTTRRLAALAFLVVLAGTTLAACGGDDDSVTAPPRDTGATTTSGAGTTKADTTPSGTVAPTAPGVDLTVTFLRADRVGVAHRRVAPTQAVARAALEQLIDGPNAAERDAGMTTVIGSGTTVTGLDIADGVATVTLSPDFGRGSNDVTAEQARAQVVFTLTQFPTVDRVRFGATGDPVGRAEFAAVTPMILVESVAPGDTITSPVEIAGLSNTFENNVRLKVVAADGAVLADTFTTGQGEMGTWGPFEASVPFVKGTSTAGTVVVWEDSPKDGSMINVVEIPVRFA